MSSSERGSGRQQTRARTRRAVAAEAQEAEHAQRLATKERHERQAHFSSIAEKEGIFSHVGSTTPRKRRDVSRSPRITESQGVFDSAPATPSQRSKRSSSSSPPLKAPRASDSPPTTGNVSEANEPAIQHVSPASPPSATSPRRRAPAPERRGTASSARPVHGTRARKTVSLDVEALPKSPSSRAPALAASALSRAEQLLSSAPTSRQSSTRAQAASAVSRADSLLARIRSGKSASSAAEAQPAASATKSAEPWDSINLHAKGRLRQGTNIRESRDIPPLLRLPSKYQQLHASFVDLDYVVSLVSRKHTPTFEVIRENMESRTRKTFTKTLLAKIVAVYPEAFEIKLVTIRDKQLGTSTTTLSVSLQDDFADVYLRPDVGSSPLQRAIRTVDTELLSLRAKRFKLRLLDIVKARHQEHLDTLPGSPKVPFEQVQRWHSSFKLEGVPDIEPARLPEPPKKKVLTAEEALLTLKTGTAGVSSAARRGLQKAAESSKSASKGDGAVDATTAGEAVENQGGASAKSPQEQQETREQVLARMPAALKGVCSVEDFLRMETKQKKESERKITKAAQSNQDPRLEKLRQVTPTIHYALHGRGGIDTEDHLAQTIGQSSGVSKRQAAELIALAVDMCPKWLTRLRYQGQPVHIREETTSLAAIRKMVQDGIAAKKAQTQH